MEYRTTGCVCKLEFGLSEIWARVKSLAAELRARLGEVQGVTVTDIGKEQCGIITFIVEGKDPLEIRRVMTANKINVWSSVIEATRIDMEERHLQSVVRASLHYYNSEEEVSRFCEVLQAIS